MKRNIFLSVFVFLAAVVTSAAQDLVILHTNDTHSQIDVQKSGEYKGLGGVERRYNLFQEIIGKYGREIVLVLDAGDYNQGSPYFTEYNGDLEVSGEITGYDTRSLGVTADEVSSKTRLTITVKINFINRKHPEEDFERSFSGFEDYDSNYTLDQVEGELVDTIVEKIVEDVFNATVANW